MKCVSELCIGKQYKHSAVEITAGQGYQLQSLQGVKGEAPRNTDGLMVLDQIPRGS